MKSSRALFGQPNNMAFQLQAVSNPITRQVKVKESDLYRSLHRLKTENERMEEEGLYAEGALALVLRMSLWVGITPVQIRRAGAGWSFHVSKPMAILQGTVITLLNLILLVGTILDFCQSLEKRIHASPSVIEIFDSFSYCISVMVIASMAVYRGPAHMKSLKRVMAQLDQIKLDLNIIHTTTDKTERVRSAFIVILLMWVVAVMLTTFVLFYLNTSPIANDDRTRIIIWSYIVFYISDFQGVIAAVKWACTVLAVNDITTTLNHHLQWLQNGSNILSPPSETEFLIRRLALAHEHISAIMREINETFGRMLAIVLMSESLRLVLVLMQYDSLGIPLCLNWWLMRMAVLMLTIEPCHWTHTQREYTLILLSHLIQHLAPKCKRLSQELDQFAKQIMLSDVKFGTQGAYALDRKLTAQIFGGVTTYVVILIQFQSLK